MYRVGYSKAPDKQPRGQGTLLPNKTQLPDQLSKLSRMVVQNRMWSPPLTIGPTKQGVLGTTLFRQNVVGVCCVIYQGVQGLGVCVCFALLCFVLLCFVLFNFI